MNNARTFNQEQNKLFKKELKNLTRKIRWLAWYRLSVFIALFFPFSLLGLSWVAGVLTLGLLVLFFYLIKVNLRLDRQRKKCAVLKQLTEDELLALDHSFLHFKNGAEFLDTNHFFSYDLDLFGDGSLYQYLSRTSTIGGAKKLASWFIKSSTNKEEIESRQHAVRELSEKREWRLQFLAEGKLFEETEVLSREITGWSETEFDLRSPEITQWIIRLIPALTLLAIIPAVLGISNTYLVLAIFAQWLMVYFYRKRISHYFGFFGRKSRLLSKYMLLLEQVEQQDFQSAYLQNLQQAIKHPSAGQTFRQLKKRVEEFEYRQNLLVGSVLNSFLLWDIRCVFQLWRWHRENHRSLVKWIDVVAEVDALISLANYADNHPDFVYPLINDDDFILGAKELGHPLIRQEKRVCNDFGIDGWSKVMIVTGANMAGKSTFLRTLGVNLLLAQSGAPVCAQSMTVTPIDLYTNMRTTDSLLKDESYFFAELKRIKGVLDRLQNGDRIFVILDEMLKGTNSVDKLNGSKELIRKLVQYQSVSLIATHDLKLSEMQQEFPEQVFNKCFEIRIENDELVFDYKLSDGFTKTMNATFLMKKMGII
ncbi:MAG: MutS-related protein [Draconibacterium sp.]